MLNRPMWPELITKWRR